MTTVDFINANLPESVRGRIDVNLLAQRLEEGKTLQGGRIVGSGRSRTHGVQYEDGFKLPVAARDRKDVDQLNKTLRSFEQSFRDYDTQRKAEEAAAKAAEEARIKAEEEARRKAEEEAAAKVKAETEARLKAEEEARIKAETEAMLKAEAEARVKAAEEARLNAEAEDKRRAEEEARLKAEAESRAKAEALALAKEMADNAIERTRLAKEEAAAKTVTAMTPTPTYDQTEAAIPTAELPQAPQAQPIPVQSVTPVKEAAQTQSAAPQTATYRFDYTGTGGNIDPTLLNPMGQSPQNFFQQRLEGFSPGAQTVMYKNQFGTTIPVTEVNGQPLTAVPPGYTRAAAKGGLMTYAEGGVVGDFSPEQSASILAKMFGYQGPAKSDSIQQFLAANPAAAARMGKYREAMSKMVGGQTASGFQGGGVVDDFSPEQSASNLAEMFFQGGGVGPEQLQAAQQNLVMQAAQPIQQAVVTPIVPSEGQFIAADAGQTTPIAPMQEAAQIETVAQAAAPIPAPVATMQPATAATDVAAETANLQAAQGQAPASIAAAQGQITQQAVAPKVEEKFIQKAVTGTLTVTDQQLAKAAGQQEQAIRAEIAQADNVANAVAQQGVVLPEELPKPAQIAESEMAQAQAMTMQGLTKDATAVAAKLKNFNVDDGTLALAAQGDVSALSTVQGQLQSLMRDFDDGTPTWASGAIRAANAAMAARGLGGSSIAGAAIVQAAMESAIPIAAQDAQVFANMNLQNLNNRQQVALANAAAQQGLSLQNLNNEQQVALQNSSNAFALQSQNLSNVQQVVLANAQIKAALQGQNLSNRQQANLVQAARYAEVANINLNNRQQTALQNNANSLQVALSNLSAKQQSYITNANLAAALQGQQISNEQQTAITNAARFSEASNIQFNAEQQSVLHNSNLMQTIGLAELNTQQAVVLQNAATLAQMDMANLNNRQQAAVQNAQNFLQMDMANLSNRQQTEIFKSQQNIQAIFTDQAAENAAAQFNATSENQTNQFFASLASQTAQFNAAQTNAINQTNVGQTNAMREFNATIQQQRDLFNAQNGLVIAQANAQWRQNLDTVNTAAQNAANMEFARTLNAMSAGTLDQIWQRERDMMSFAFSASESAQDRALSVLLADKNLEAFREKLKNDEDTARAAAWTKLLLDAIDFS